MCNNISSFYRYRVSHHIQIGVTNWRKRSAVAVAIAAAADAVFTQWKITARQLPRNFYRTLNSIHVVILFYFLFQFWIYLSSVHAASQSISIQWKDNDLRLILSLSLSLSLSTHNAVTSVPKPVSMFACKYFFGFYEIFRILTFVNIDSNFHAKFVLYK